MTKFDDFDLDISFSNVNDYIDKNINNWSDDCPPIISKYCATQGCTKICTKKCQTITISCNCSAGDNTTACNQLRDLGIEVARC